MCIIHNIKKLYMTRKAASERDPWREDPSERKPDEDTTRSWSSGHTEPGRAGTLVTRA